MILHVYMISYIRRITSHCRTAALVQRAVCSSLRSPSCAAVTKYACRPVPSWKQGYTARAVEKKKYRPSPSWNKLYTVPSRREKLCAPSTSRRAKNIYRPVPSWQVLFAVPPLRDNFYLPPGPIVTILLTVPSRRDNFYLPSYSVMKQKGRCTVASRPFEKIHTHRPVPSHPGNYIFHYFTVPSRLQKLSRQTCQNSTVPFRLEYYRPWKALVFLVSRVPV